MKTENALVVVALAAALLSASASAGVKPRAAATAASPGKNGKIAFVRKGVIYTMDLDGSHRRRLAQGNNPAWSPDGSQIAFDRSYHVYVMGSDGSGVRELTWVEGTSPAWEPDGATVIFVSGRVPPGTDCTSDITDFLWTVNSDGSGLLHPFTPNLADVCGIPGGDDEPAVSRSGRVAYSVWQYVVHSYYDTWIDVASADGSQRVKVPGSETGLAPSWSPNGKSVAFAVQRKGAAAIYAARPGVSTAQGLTKFIHGLSDPAWSPNGKTIAFARWGRQRGLYLLSVKTGKLRRLTRGYDQAPDWQPVPD